VIAHLDEDWVRELLLMIRSDWSILGWEMVLCLVGAKVVWRMLVGICCWWVIRNEEELSLQVALLVFVVLGHSTRTCCMIDHQSLNLEVDQPTVVGAHQRCTYIWRELVEVDFVYRRISCSHQTGAVVLPLIVCNMLRPCSLSRSRHWSTCLIVNGKRALRR
jgi:hypothetical protein